MNITNLRFHFLNIQPCLWFHVHIKNTPNTAQLSPSPPHCHELSASCGTQFYSVENVSCVCSPICLLLFSLSLSRSVQESDPFKCKTHKYVLISSTTRYISFATMSYSICIGRTVSSTVSQLQPFQTFQLFPPSFLFLCPLLWGRAATKLLSPFCTCMKAHLPLDDIQSLLLYKNNILGSYS